MSSIKQRICPRRYRGIVSRLAAWVVIALAGAGIAAGQSPPPQPLSGPGGSQALHTILTSTYDTGNRQYWIYLPQPLAVPAPVVIFMHGFAATTPAPYQAWIDHIVRRGNIVIYPRYQEDAREPPALYTANAIEALKSAFAMLGNSADPARVALVSHSLGGVLSFNIAARAAASGLPIPKAILAAHPGDTQWAELSNYHQIPSTTLVLMLVGDADVLVGDATAKNMIAAIPHIPGKNFITVQSDAHGLPSLAANHIAPNAPPVDALDYYVYWKLADALVGLAFQGIDGYYAFGGGALQTFAGVWSDSVPVRALALRPTISIPDIVNAASLRPGPIAPGEMVRLSGAGLGPGLAQSLELDAEGRLTTSNSGTRVLFDGVPVPIVYTFANQVAAVAPAGIARRSAVSIQVQSGAFTSEPVTISTAPANPGVFAMNGSGFGPGAILNQNSSANSGANPALKGSSVTIFATGAGETNPPSVDGAIAEGALPQPILPLSVTIGGVQAEVTYAGASPGFLNAIIQINIRIPANVPSGYLPVVLTVGGASSQRGITVVVK